MHPFENDFPMANNPQRSWVSPSHHLRRNFRQHVSMPCISNAFCYLPSFFCTQNGVWEWNDKLTFTAWLAVSSQRLTGNWLKMVGYPSTNWRDTHQLTFSTKRGLLVKIIHSMGFETFVALFRGIWCDNYGLTKTFAVFLVNREGGVDICSKVKSLKEKGLVMRN